MIDLTRQKFGRLVVVKQVGKNKSGNYKWLCKCECGEKTIVQGGHLKSGYTKSCGCFQKEIARKQFTKHGHSKTEIYKSWNHMIDRCINPNNKRYKDYGGRGIAVCKRWMKFPNFLKDIGKSWKPGLTIERENNDEGYCRENCKWATRKEQNRNSRHNHLITCFGKTQCLAEWVEEYNINYKTLWNRLNLGQSIEKALTTPIRKYNKNE